MSRASSAGFGNTFCSYCGYPPPAPSSMPHRVCMRCQMGMVLTAAPEAVPTYADPFVIVDDRLTVQALSRRAEDVLGVDEPAGVNVPLDHFLVPDRGNADRVELGRAVALALRGESPRTTLEFRRIDDPQVRFRARVASCGPPAAALLILAEPTDEAAAATNGSRRVGFNGNGSGRREGNGAA